MKLQSREKAARLIENQLNWNTTKSDNSPGVHYGLRELHELMDFIYGSEPTRDEDRIRSSGKGWH